MTNGEKIKATFPHYDIEVYEHKGYVRVFYKDFYITYPLRWWDAEYEEPVIRDNGIKDELNRVKDELEPTTKNDLAHNLCDSCTNIGCEFQSGIVRTKCAFYMPPQHSSGLAKNSKKLEKNFGESDCISRADAIQAMQDKAKKITNEDTINGLCGAVAILFDLPSVTPQEPRWISVSERLPKAGEYVGNVAKYYLVQNEYGDMLVARYTHSEYWEQMYQLKPISDEVVAWRELPKQYKVESEKMSKHWIDDADHWICPDCGFIAINPNRYAGCKCPKCGFQDEKDKQKVRNK